MESYLILALLLVLSGVFSGSETALINLSMARAEALYREGRRGAQALYLLKKDPSRMLITILIGNNVVNIAASAMATVIATDYFGDTGPGIAVGVLTILILVFGEITPKSLATRFSERISLFIAPLIVGFMRLIYPLVWLFLQFTNWVQSSTKAMDDPLVTEHEVITLIEHGEEEGVIDTGEREMIERIFNFNDLKAEDVMTPRRQVFRIDGRRSLRDVLPQIMRENFSRIPLYKEDPDEIVSMVLVRDLIKNIVSGELDIPISDLGQEPLYTPSNTTIDELVRKLKLKSIHLAVVVDEHGAMIGVVSLEDMLEELVGEIYDETDEKPNELMVLGGGKVLVQGTAELRVVEEYYDMDIPGKPTDTINRWLLKHTERIPEKDEKFELDGFEVRVQDASLRRIHQVVLRRITAIQDDLTADVQDSS
ncbi:MAG: hemolysin family protein [Candidatus Thiodiazotropha sp. (ex Lucina aurantia)]|uniref:Magnesium and cobalt efflux protein CorC n=2 Tax=Candidatus Thiodiazotropha TaxID=1913444 RepID=A0A7Z0VKV8_9GAMM|nr:hemolysin family protein [Candidatus Thiodiazotropha endolucinida]MBT3012057.1 hemolysin family protein [Candidatus Thiodiazotropha sp. (ex Lucina pensylvanica)]MBT3015839.1 hemolysin family protein [Candidatus Thiodiazotropha taylori]MBT3038516.1 hemolysin family protein [Candidatus Thiodiazotropha sp. (ex Codakia orbicularis)]MBV2104981.1 hemolysin family protein [Candidatus Thiodiazotropha sp. (ex Lucina aurantia)]MBT3024835.1 hemolysin family protein [Candidatus Thiodiazotropha taylori]